jgi:hypothetical protein
MTDRTHDQGFEREIRRFLAQEAEDLGAAPRAMEMAARVATRVGSGAPGLRVSPRLGLVALVGLLLLALAGGLIAVGMLPRQTDVPQQKSHAYEAVFLRDGALVGGFTEILVVGVNAQGRERAIATLTGSWLPLAGPKAAPGAAVSPSGLLALASNTGEAGAGMVFWEIVDLHRPQVHPIIIPGVRQWVEELRETPYYWVNTRGGAFWGPGDRLALLWYFLPNGGIPDVQLTFVDGRTGTTSPAPIPDDLIVLPYWAADGSGVYVGTDASIDPPGPYPPQVLRPDGSVVPTPDSLAVPSCRTPEGFDRACLAPDGSMILDYGGSEGGSPGLIGTATDTRFAVDGSFAGWMEAAP